MMLKLFVFPFLLSIIFFQACSEGATEKPKIADTTILINEQLRPIKNNYADVDISPLDMSYYPTNYPQLKMSNLDIEQPVMRVIYSRPHLQNRTLFHDILKYDEPWRLGANEATELQVYQPVWVGGNKLNSGRYTLFCIPHEKEWTIAFNSLTDIWGLKYDASKNLFTVSVPVNYNNLPLEYFTMVFEKTEAGANLIMAWGNVVVKLPFRLIKN
jgi:hypothetical protein